MCHLALGLCFVVLAALGCAAPTSTSDDEAAAGPLGKADSAELSVLDPEDPELLAALDELYAEGGEPIENIRDLFSVTVVTDAGPLPPVPTHVFGDGTVNLIPYADMDHVQASDGTRLRGDGALARHFAPGEIGFVIKHHRPERRVIDLRGGGDPEAMKEDFKLQDTHIMLAVGVERNATYEPGSSNQRTSLTETAPGVITLNNPQSYPNRRDGYPGRFGSSHYSSATGRMELHPQYAPMFFRPTYPGYVDEAEPLADGTSVRDALRDNMRTMALGFNAVSNFPVGQYNGNDPLAASTPEKVYEHVAMMIRALGGDSAARAWWNRPENLVYCAELAHVVASAAMLVPLNESFIVDEMELVDRDAWEAFEAQIDLHMRGRPHRPTAAPDSNFVNFNVNKLVRTVAVTVSPADLRPAWEYAPEEAQGREASLLAFAPMTMADIVQSFLQVHVPRIDAEGGYHPEMAPVQGALLAGMKDGILETMGLGPTQLAAAQESGDAAALAQIEAQRDAVGQLYDQIVAIVEDPEYATYDEFRATLHPYMQQAREITGQRGSALFVPPSLLHMVARGQWNTAELGASGTLGLTYVGHGVHFGVVPGFAVEGF